MTQHRWKRVWYRYCFLLGFLLLLAACSNRQDVILENNSEKPIPLYDSANESMALHLTLLETNIDPLLALDLVSSKLYYVSYQEAAIVDQDLQHINASSLSPGMTLEVIYHGITPQTDPMMIESVTQLTVIDDKPSFLSAYYDIITNIAEKDSALNQDITMVALDLSQATNLTKEEKTTLTNLVAYSLNTDCFQSTYEQLVQHGLIDTEQLSFPKGILIQVVTTGEKNSSFTFSVSKWRSGDGALGYSDCTATQEVNYWSYDYKNAWVS